MYMLQLFCYQTRFFDQGLGGPSGVARTVPDTYHNFLLDLLLCFVLELLGGFLGDFLGYFHIMAAMSGYD